MLPLLLKEHHNEKQICIYSVPSNLKSGRLGWYLFGNFSEAQAGSCTRNSARMAAFLLADRERDADRKKSPFPLVNRVFFETKRNVLKSMVSES